MERGKINNSMETSENWNNTFLLKRISINSNSPSVQVDFSPATNTPLPDSFPTSPSPFYPSFPTFNHDSTYFTPSFVLPIDKSKYVEKASCYLSLHQSKMQQLSVQKTQLFVPKPSKNNSYCCICKTIFDDYLTHVNIPNHQQLMHASKFTQSIQQLCLAFVKDQVEPALKKNKGRSKKIEKMDKPKRKYTKKINLLSMSTSTTLDDSAQSRKQIAV